MEPIYHTWRTKFEIKLWKMIWTRVSALLPKWKYEWLSTYICHSERLLTNNKSKLQRNYNTTQASWTTATAIEQRQIKHTTTKNWNGILTNDAEIPSTRASISASARTTTKQRTNTPKWLHLRLHLCIPEKHIKNKLNSQWIFKLNCMNQKYQK